MIVEKEIVLRFSDEGVAAPARLLWEEAPVTCRAICDALPVAGRAHHAVYSGSEVAFILPQLLRLDREHATTEVRTGDVGFTWFAEGSSYGVDRDFAEICWFYDRDAVPSMFEGPTPVNVFARLENADGFFELCRRMRLEGAKAFEIQRLA